MNDLVKTTFTITYVSALVIAALCFIEAISSENEFHRHVLNINTALLLITAYFYNVYLNNLYLINLSQMRLFESTLSLPLMILILFLFIKENVSLFHFVCMVFYVWLMIFFRYLGEINEIPSYIACIGGYNFLLFVYLFFIYRKEATRCYLYWVYMFVFTLYAIIFFIPESDLKIISYNITDFISKPFIAFCIFCSLTKIIKI
jgi:hypothetical protein